MLSAARRAAVVLALAVLCGPAAAAQGAPAASGKIGFDPSHLDAAGLYGPAGGLRALDYEFCIPDRARAVARVQAIDPSVRVYRSPGRIGCPRDRLLCIGNTQQSGYRGILAALARLVFVERIEQAHFE